jgi:hypothetical protein
MPYGGEKNDNTSYKSRLFQGKICVSNKTLCRISLIDIGDHCIENNLNRRIHSNQNVNKSDFAS